MAMKARLSERVGARRLEPDDPFRFPRSEFIPAYLKLDRVELRARAARGLEELRRCRVCPRNCDVDRVYDRTAFCRAGRHAWVSSFFPHFG